MRPTKNATNENATDENATNENATNENITDCLYLILYIIDRETKELLPYGIFIITRRYKRVKIRVIVEELSPNKKH